MPLFIDGPSVTVEDLVNEDSGLLDVAKSCGINVSTKILLAHDELGTDLNLLIARVNAGDTTGEMLGLRQVAVTSSLKKWETMMSLSAFYRDAYFSQLVDRFQAKWKEYTQLTQVANNKFIAGGIGFVSDPAPRAEAPLLNSVPGPQSGGVFYAVVTWVNAAGQEGEPSIASSLTVADGNLMTVMAINAPSSAIGFNVYAGPILSSLLLQTSTPLSAGLSFTYIPGQMAEARTPGTGQSPDFFRSASQMMLRG